MPPTGVAPKISGKDPKRLFRPISNGKSACGHRFFWPSDRIIRIIQAAVVVYSILEPLLAAPAVWT
jgi:hypothetical protein